MTTPSGSDVVQAKREIRDRVLGKPIVSSARMSEALVRAGSHIHGIGVGRKIVAGKRTKTRSVRVYVTHKLPQGMLSPASRIPRFIEGIPTDVVEAPQAFFATVHPPCSIQKMQKQRPVRGGISGAGEAVLAGTIGAVCRSTVAGEQGGTFIVSNYHVFAQMGAAPGVDAILQPSPQDGGLSSDVVANLHRYTDILAEPHPNRIDAAIAVLAPGIVAAPGICGLDMLPGFTPPSDGEAVHKHGRTTGYTVGIVDDMSVDVRVPFSRVNPDLYALFVDQIRLTPRSGTSTFARFGDSGALVVSRSSSMAVGLLFACPDNGSFAYANPISSVLLDLGIELV